MAAVSVWVLGTFGLAMAIMNLAARLDGRAKQEAPMKSGVWSHTYMYGNILIYIHTHTLQSGLNNGLRSQKGEYRQYGVHYFGHV